LPSRRHRALAAQAAVTVCSWPVWPKERAASITPPASASR
jgi:hypothetical protein